MNQPDLNKLKSTLLTSGLQLKDPPLYQVINSLIEAVRQFQSVINADITNINNIINNNIINNINEGNILQLLYGNESNGDSDIIMIGSSEDSEFVEWSVLTNGDPVSPELIFADGDVIMVHVP